MTDLGADTRDLGNLGIPHPAEHGLPAKEREDQLQRFGSRCRWWGAAILAADIIAALGTTYYAHHEHWNNPAARTFAGLAFILVGFVATALLTAGLVEYIFQPMRTLIRAAMARASANASELVQNRRAIQDCRRAVNDCVEVAEKTIAVNNRLISEAVVTMVGVQKEIAGMQDKLAAVPDYAKGVTEGIQLRNGFINGFPDLSVDDFRGP